MAILLSEQSPPYRLSNQVWKSQNAKNDRQRNDHLLLLIAFTVSRDTTRCNAERFGAWKSVYVVVMTGYKEG